MSDDQNIKTQPVDNRKTYTQSYQGVQDIVRHHDKDRYLISLMMPRQYRTALWSVFAFNYEISKTRSVVSETTIGLIRLQWWRDAINEIYDGQTPRNHEVVTPLSKVITQYDLPKELFESLIYAREFDLEGVAPANFEGLLNYCDYTNTPLNQICLKIMGNIEDGRIVKTVSQFYGVIGTLRAVPYMLQYGQVLFPQDVMREYNVDAQKIHDFNKKEEIVCVINDLLKEAESLKNQFRNDDMLIRSRYLKGLYQLTQSYAYRIRKVKGDVFSERASMPMPLLPLKVWFKTIF